MLKSEIFSTALSAVSEKTEISAEDILSRKRGTEIVDARFILARTLQIIGFYPAETGKFMRRTAACVRRMLNGFENRKATNKLIGSYMKEIRDELESKS